MAIENKRILLFKGNEITNSELRAFLDGLPDSGVVLIKQVTIEEGTETSISTQF